MLKILALCILLCFQGAVTSQFPEYCGKTPRSLTADFDDSCKIVMTSNPTICPGAFKEFTGAFSGMDPDKVVATNYDRYLTVLPVVAKGNQSLFWSGTFPIVQIIGKNNLGVTVVASTNSPSSEIIVTMPQPVLGLYWCGMKNGGVDYRNDCKCRVTVLFWEQFSAFFARASSETVFFSADGERATGGFNTTSFFATVELPNMSKDKVKAVTALVIHRQGKGDTCVTGSMVTLQQYVVDKHKFKFECYEIYGQATNPKYTQRIAECVADVIGQIQKGQAPPKITPCV